MQIPFYMKLKRFLRFHVFLFNHKNLMMRQKQITCNSGIQPGMFRKNKCLEFRYRVFSLSPVGLK